MPSSPRSARRAATLVLAAGAATALAAALAACGDEVLPIAAPTPPPVAPPPPTTPGDSGAATLRATVVATGLTTPWELAWGPDGRLWIAERGGRISRLDVATGTRAVAGTLAVTESGESGLMGIVFHPEFAREPFLYAMHSYTAGGGIRNRLVRMRVTDGSLGTPEPLLENIPGATIHDGARLAIGPDRLLYVSTGDANVPALSQDRASLAGKILRLTLDGRPAPGNPGGTAVWALGLRNPQGLAVHPRTGALYASEHGPNTDDEVNLLRAGANYGWPTVRGFCDGSDERPFCDANAVVEPLVAWTPTIAPAGLVVYDAPLVPRWRNSLLLVTLKDATLHRLALSDDGTRVTARETLYRGTYGRLRAVTVGPRGEIYLATSNRDGRGRPGGEDDRVIRLEP